MALAVISAHQQPADQPRPPRHRNRIEPAELDAGRAHGLGDDLVQALHMRAGRDLRHDTAVAAVLPPLRPHYVGQDPPAAVGRASDDGSRRLVAARLDAEHEALAPPLGAAAVG